MADPHLDLDKLRQELGSGNWQCYNDGLEVQLCLVNPGLLQIQFGANLTLKLSIKKKGSTADPMEVKLLTSMPTKLLFSPHTAGLTMHQAIDLCAGLAGTIGAVLCARVVEALEHTVVRVAFAPFDRLITCRQDWKSITIPAGFDQLGELQVPIRALVPSIGFEGHSVYKEWLPLHLLLSRQQLIDLFEACWDSGVYFRRYT